GAQGAWSTVTRVSTTAAVNHALVLTSLAHDPIAVTVDVGPFVDPKGVSIPASTTLDGAPGRAVTLPPLGTAALAITATLPGEAEYTSEISLSYGETHQLAHLTVVRAAEPLAVTIRPLDPLRAEALPFWTTSASLDVVLEETAGRTTALETFTLISFAAKAGDAKHQVQAHLEPDAA